MKICNIKCLKVMTNGSLYISYKFPLKVKQVFINEKDSKNFYLNKKNSTFKNLTDSTFNYKKKYFK
jgi:hypothetical protein